MRRGCHYPARIDNTNTFRHRGTASATKLRLLMMKKKKSLSLYEGKPLEYYDNWVTLEGGFVVAHPQLKGVAGLYRALLHGEVIFIGKGAGIRAGLYERLYDLRRPGDSGRRYRAGRFINDHLDQLELQVNVIGRDWSARKLASALLRPMIKVQQPKLNVDPEFKTKIIQESYKSR